LKADDRDGLRLLVMLPPGGATPLLPSWVRAHTRVGHNLMAAIAETDAGTAIAWARAMVSAGIAEEYALAATTLEDIYIRLTAGRSEVDAADPVGART